MRELFGIGHDVDGLNQTAVDLDRQYRERTALRIADDSRFTVDLRHAAGQIVGHELSKATENRARYLLRSMNQVRHCGSFPSAIGVQHGFARKQRHELFQIARSRCLPEIGKQLLPLLDRSLKARTQLCHMEACPAKNLPAVCLALIQNAGDLRVLVVEYFAKQKDGAFGRRESLQQYQ